jgi:hypothetical protein
VFNPAQSKRILMNYFYTRSQFEVQGLPVFTLELVYEGRQPEIPDAIHVKGNSYMFHKENMYRILNEKIPSHFKKLAFLDADVFFKDPSWYEQASKELETYNVVQPFESAHWLDLTYTKELLSKKTMLLFNSNDLYIRYHPGFAWCMQREWYQTYGFFDYALSGGSDGFSYAGWLKKELSKDFQKLPQSINSIYEEFKTNVQEPTITYLRNIDIYHLYHGTLTNRRYAIRQTILNSEKNILDIICKNKDGLFEWKDPDRWNPIFLNYFKLRSDDDI